MNGLPQVRVGVQAVVRRGDEYLFVQRAGGYGAGLWCFPGGHLEPGETVAECAARELYEETSLTGLDFTLVAVTDPNPDANYHMQIAMSVTSWRGTPRIMDPAECSAVRFCHLDEVVLFPPTLDVVARIQEGWIYPSGS